MSPYQIKKIRASVDTFLDASTQQDITLLKPIGLKRHHLQSLKPNEWEMQEWVDSCRWIIHCIMNGYLNDYSLKDNGLVPLNSQALKQILGDKYKQVLDGLIDGGIVCTDGQYSKTKHISMGYGLNQPWLNQHYVFRSIRPGVVSKKIKHYRRKQVAKLKKKADRIPWITQWLIQDSLQMDKSEAIEFLDFLERAMYRDVDQMGLRKPDVCRVRKQINARIIRYRHQVEHFKMDAGFSMDDKGGRIYTRLTQLPGILKPFLTYQGEPLVSIDIKNSQPYHLTLALRKEFWSEKASHRRMLKRLTLADLDPDLFDALKRNLDTSFPSIMFPENAESPNRQASSILSFSFLATIGKLYEFTANKISGKLYNAREQDRFENRTLAKQEIIHMFFFNPDERYSHAQEVFEEFSRLFPAEAAVLEVLKLRHYTDLPVLLQKLEAQMVLHRIAKRIAKVDPSIPIFTIHDSILTIPAHAKLVQNAVEAEYQSIYGSIPQLEVQLLDQPHASIQARAYRLRKLEAMLPKNAVQRRGKKMRVAQVKSVERYVYDHYFPDFAKYVSFPSL